MTFEQNKSVVQAYIRQVLTGGLDQLDEYVSDCYVDHSCWGDREGLRRTIAEFRAAYPRIEFKIKDLVAERDRVAARIWIEATSEDSRKVINATVIFRMHEGKIVEHWGNSDSFL